MKPRARADAALGVGVRLAGPTDFEGWRRAARSLVLSGVPPQLVSWHVDGEGGDLFGGDAVVASSIEPPPAGPQLTVSRRFLDMAASAICHSAPDRFALLYSLLWRQQRERGLVDVASDFEVMRLRELDKAVRRDVHKMRAFVRFRMIEDEQGERHVAWFEPDHHIVERNAPFFVRRFTGMRWTILTPRGSADWDGKRLAIGPGASRADAPAADDADELWRTYFRSIFNPARLKVKAMQAEMPKKYWRNLPEASLIPELVQSASSQATIMIDKAPSHPAPHHAAVQARHWQGRTEVTVDQDAEATSLAQPRTQASACRRCPLWQDATQTVFGEGPEDAEIVFVGEQPGDQEDLAGRPFVGPAGRLFDAVLEDVGIDRSTVYVTNAVKHFKFEPRGKRRIHQKPNAGEVQACRWWLDEELALLKPKLVIALGATAVHSLLGRALPVTKHRGEVIEREDGLKVFVTVHPSYLLRLPDPELKRAEEARFRDDLAAVRRLMEG